VTLEFLKACVHGEWPFLMECLFRPFQKADQLNVPKNPFSIKKNENKTQRVVGNHHTIALLRNWLT
jgi:hypothetical protein